MVSLQPVLPVRILTNVSMTTLLVLTISSRAKQLQQLGLYRDICHRASRIHPRIGIIFCSCGRKRSRGDSY